MKYGGMTETEALAMVTINPAKQFGIDNRVGSIEVGKDADLAIFDKHPLSNYAKVRRFSSTAQVTSTAIRTSAAPGQKAREEKLIDKEKQTHRRARWSRTQGDRNEIVRILTGRRAGACARPRTTRSSSAMCDVYPVTSAEMKGVSVLVRRWEDRRDRPKFVAAQRHPRHRGQRPARLSRPDRFGHRTRPF